MLEVLLALMMQSGAVAIDSPPASTPRPAIVVPDWRSRATGEDVGRVYPRDAMRRRVEGIVLVVCHVTAEGTMADCVAEQEAPKGEGFGEAALKLMPKFRMRPLTRNGTPVGGGVVRLPIQFRMPR
jgi:protein TonB